MSRKYDAVEATCFFNRKIGKNRKPAINKIEEMDLDKELVESFEAKTKGLSENKKIIYALQMQMLYLSRFFGVTKYGEFDLEALRQSQLFKCVVSCHNYLQNFTSLERSERAPNQWRFICEMVTEMHTCGKDDLARIESDLYFHIDYLACDLSLNKEATLEKLA